MSVMVEALATLSRATAQPLRRQVVDMLALAKKTHEMLTLARPEWQRADLRLETLPAADADPALVSQVWQNLLENALKYSAAVASPKVRIDSFQNERGTWYRVTDNGAGFDMSHAKKLFMPLQRMHPGREFEGTGVGLSLVRRITERHGGDIRVRSAVKVGTIVEFTLDAAKTQLEGSASAAEAPATAASKNRT
jgi:signal transduction histidine kinase